MTAGSITTVRLHRLFGVNCFAVEADVGWLLVDTAMASLRADLESGLERVGCTVGDLRLILLTHAHPDHAGNCAYLKEQYGTPVAMHEADADKARRGDMFVGASHARGWAGRSATRLVSMTRLGSFAAFEPDVLVSDGQSLSEYGLEASVIHFPGHSPGSVGVLTAAADLLCGDLLTNTRRPAPTSLIDDAVQMGDSLARLDDLGIRTVYPGHGEPFPYRAYVERRKERRVRL